MLIYFAMVLKDVPLDGQVKKANEAEIAVSCSRIADYRLPYQTWTVRLQGPQSMTRAGTFQALFNFFATTNLFVTYIFYVFATQRLIN